MPSSGCGVVSAATAASSAAKPCSVSAAVRNSNVEIARRCNLAAFSTGYLRINLTDRREHLLLDLERPRKESMPTQFWGQAAAGSVDVPARDTNVNVPRSRSGSAP